MPRAAQEVAHVGGVVSAGNVACRRVQVALATVLQERVCALSVGLQNAFNSPHVAFHTHLPSMRLRADRRALACYAPLHSLACSERRRDCQGRSGDKGCCTGTTQHCRREGACACMHHPLPVGTCMPVHVSAR